MEGQPPPPPPSMVVYGTEAQGGRRPPPPPPSPPGFQAAAPAAPAATKRGREGTPIAEYTSLADLSRAFHEFKEESEKKHRLQDRETTALKTKLDRVNRDFKLVRDNLERMLGVSFRHQSRSGNQLGRDVTLVTFEPGYATPRTLAEVEFRDSGGHARYPGIDIIPGNKEDEKKKKKAAAAKKTRKDSDENEEEDGGGGEEDEEGGGRRRGRRPKEDADVVAMMPGKSEGLLGVPFYAAMEQIKTNTQYLKVLNTGVFPILESSHKLLSAICERLVPDVEMRPPPTLRVAPGVEFPGPPFLGFWDARAPHLDLTGVATRYADGVRSGRRAEKDQEMFARQKQLRWLKEMQEDYEQAKDQVARLSGILSTDGEEGGNNNNEAVASSNGALAAMQSQVDGLEKKLGDMQRSISELGNTNSLLGGGEGDDYGWAASPSFLSALPDALN